MKRAIISDVHGNLDALEAVLEHIQRQNVDEIFCLGDIVGYGPNPRECIDRVMGLTRIVLGNHDQAALFDPEGFSSTAEQAIFWTRRQLELPTHPDDPDNGPERARQEARWNFLCQLERTIRDGDYLFVHGSARNPLSEYVFPEDVFNIKKMEKIFSLIPKYCFQGHTHVPGIFTSDNVFMRPEEVLSGYQLRDEKVMINVGSVGQPRDGDRRACYVTVDSGLVRFHRVDYAAERTAAKIRAIAELDDFLGDRLLQGR
ncbi:MAG: metallophosphoesterase family protein [Pirellulaceae bacterium]|nr:metallophosphoesterase family protein [Planctomycetales bacterium]